MTMNVAEKKKSHPAYILTRNSCRRKSDVPVDKDEVS